MDNVNYLLENFKIAVVGLGYVGLPLAHVFSFKYDVTGFDISKKRIEELKNTFDKTLELSSEQLKEAIENGIVFTNELNGIKDCNIYIVTVPTPIDEYKNPDLVPIIKASETVGKVLKKGDIVIYESTVYPGCTEDDCVPVLEKYSGLKFNKDFYCGYSPERINPGDKKHTVSDILKITSGSTPEIAEEIDKLYASVIKAGTHKAPSIKVAEAAKVIENTQRDLNIALMNELALIFDKMGIDTSAVIEAAGTKWNFLKFYPGLVGGHCIGVDPYYLTFKSQAIGYNPDIIIAGRRINDGMGKFIAEKTIKKMIKLSKQINGARVLIAGFTFKEDCPDVRNTKVIDIYNELLEYGLEVDIFDPVADVYEAKKEYGVNILEEIDTRKYDSVIVAVKHSIFKEVLSFEKIKDLFVGKGVLIDVKWLYKKDKLPEEISYWKL